MSSKNVVFDAINDRLGDLLRAHNVNAALLGNTWIETAEREYTYLSLAGKYTPFVECMEKLFYRILWMADIPEPRQFATHEDIKYMINGYQHLTMRPGAVECIAKLRDAGFTVWALTAADLASVAGIFQQAGVELPSENLISCDTNGVGKPDPLAYKPLFDQLSQQGRPWFAAAHAWDVTGARKAGFRTAYSSVLEKEAIPDLFGEMEVTADALPEMAEKIIAQNKVHLYQLSWR
ncbi:hypothetical protein AWENTII_007210 [Aspergillus wentii]